MVTKDIAQKLYSSKDVIVTPANENFTLRIYDICEDWTFVGFEKFTILYKNCVSK